MIKINNFGFYDFVKDQTTFKHAKSNAEYVLSNGYYEYAVIRSLDESIECWTNYYVMYYDSVLQEFYDTTISSEQLREYFALEEAGYPMDVSMDIEDENVRKSLWRARYFLQEACKGLYGRVYMDSLHLVEAAIDTLTEPGIPNSLRAEVKEFADNIPENDLI